MKKMLHKIFSILLAACFILSAVPAPAAAAETPANTAVNGSYTDGKWIEGGTGSVTHDIDGTKVTLSKTAAPVEGQENTFDITLKVETSTSTSLKTNSGAVVLVIDVSGSMDFCAECRGESTHRAGCKYDEPETYPFIGTVHSAVTASQSRLVAAKAAAQNFLKAYAGTDAAANRQLAIVTFATKYTTLMSWTNVAGGSGNSGYITAQKTINDLSADGGTNMEGGLYTASELLKSVSDYNSKSVILLSDGAPTYNINGVGPGDTGSKEINSAVVGRATTIKESGANLYTVCFGAADQVTYYDGRNPGPTVGAFLSGSVASSGCAYNADSSAELYAAFKAISESITSGLSGEGWTATDPMADMISVTSGTGENFSGSEGTYTWKLSNAETVTEGNTTKYVYSYTYRVTLNVQGENFVEGQPFPTNKPTYLNVGDQQYAFPVPGVTGVLPRTDVSVTKVWDDNDNQDGKRSSSVTVQLVEIMADETVRNIGDPVVLDADNSWTHTWDGETYNLIEKSKGDFHVYSVIETPVGFYKDPVATDSSEGNFELTVTNTHEIIKTSVTVTKVWADNNDQDGIRPESIEVELLANGNSIGKTATLSGEGNEWTYTFEGLDMYANGQEIEYKVKELTKIDDYDSTYSDDGLIVTNTHAPEQTSVEVKKIWDDNSDQDGIRPDSVTVQLYANDEAVREPVVLEGTGNEWTYTFTNLDKYAGGVEIVYTVKEVSELPAGYTKTERGLTITNTHTPDVVSKTVTKIWDDNNNQDGIRPDSIEVELLANEVSTGKTATLNNANEWKYEFTGLPKNAAGQEIEYTARETKVPAGYTSSLPGLTITNTHEIEKTSVKVTKVWNDADNQDGKRPQFVTIELWANDVNTGKTLVLTESSNWTGTFSDLDKKAGGEIIVYKVYEKLPEGTEYTQESIAFDEAEGFTITNKYTPKTTTVSGTKTWDDADNQDGNRPTSITINLFKEGETIATKTVTADDNWSWTFENLPMYENGQLISYGISEDRVEGYTTQVNGYDVTNTDDPDKTTVTVNKVWVDDSNRDGIRPNYITVKLLADGKDTGKTLILNQNNGWTGIFDDLAKNNKGKPIEYTVDEIEVSDYDVDIVDNKNGTFTITNTHEIYTTEVSGTKTWEDKNDQDGVRPKSITVYLKANGKTVATKEVTEADGWAFQFTNLPLKENGTAIDYSVEEDMTKLNELGYTATYDDYNITNTYSPETRNILVNKIWADGNNQDGLRPDEIIVKLLADGEDTRKTLKLTAENNWSDSFTDLDKKAAGKDIIYTVTEEQVEGYDVDIVDNKNGTITITNTHEPGVMDIVGQKTWNDAENQDGKRPDSITVNLLANGQTVDTLVVTSETNWIYTFKNLPKFAAGAEIDYTVVENEVPGYSAEYYEDNYNITNSYTPEIINIKITKSWLDSNDADGIRPSKVTIYLYANGEKTGDKLELTAKDKWTGSFTDLPKYEDGKEIKYTIAEKDVKGYKATYKGSAEKGHITVTNSHNTIPSTGDERTPILWIAMMIIGVIAVFFATMPFFKKKGKYSR